MKASAGTKTRGGPRGAAAAVKRRSLKSGQGGALPDPGAPIAEYPVGCCVLLEAGASVGPDPAWYLIRFRIGGSGLPHLGRLTAPPGAPGWNVRMGAARSADPTVVVLAVCWPYRSGGDGSGGESGDDDPLALASAEDGSLMLSHLRSARSGPVPEEKPGTRGE